MKTPIAFATHLKGRVGYVGDMNIEGSKDAAQIIVAMCLYPGSKAPIAPGTGGPPVSSLLSSCFLGSPIPYLCRFREGQRPPANPSHGATS